MSLNVYVATSGSHGDVHPFLAIGKALQARGHAATVSVHPHFGRDVQAAGLPYTPIGEEIDFDAVLRDPLIMHPWRGGRAVMKMVVAAVPRALRRHRALLEQSRPDVIVAHHICIGLRWVAEALDIPIVLCSLSPMLWFSPHDPVPILQRGTGWWWERAARSLQQPLLSVCGPLENWKMNALRRKCGFPPESRAFWKEFHGGAVNLGLWSAHLRGPAPGDPPNGRICGFPWYDRSDVHATLPAALERFLAAGDAPVVFSLGTAAVHVPGDFYHIAADACRISGRRGVLLVGPGTNVPGDLPPSMIVVDYVPFSLILPRGCCTVHHGGIGSTSQGLRSGRPAVVVPHAHDQFHNGLHARRLGVAELLPRPRMTAKRLAEAIGRLVTPEVERRAAELRTALLAEDGAAAACDEIERVANDAKRGG